MTDYEATYREVRLRVIDLVRDLPDTTVDLRVPATPSWRVRDIVAHLGGVCDDIAHGRMEGIATDRWTAAQVEKRRDWPFAQVLDDWSEHAAVVEPMLNGIGHPIGQMIFDAWTHEQDIRGAIGMPGARSGPAVDTALEWFAHASAASTDRPALRVIADGDALVLGGGEPATTVRASKFELLRAFTGRRSLSQVQAFDSEGADLEEIIFFHEFFTPAAHDIIE